MYWSGIPGNRKVVLRKVDSTHTSVGGKKLTIYKGKSERAYSPKGETSPLEELTSGDSGCFYAGMLPYGWYVVKETEPETYFYFVVVKSGVYGMEDVGDQNAEGGYATRAPAQEAAKAKYNELKDR